MKRFYLVLLVFAAGCYDSSDKGSVLSVDIKKEICIGGEYYGNAACSKDETYELFLRNPFDECIEFSEAELDGCVLPLANQGVREALKNFTFEFKGKALRPATRKARVSACRWCQFYPSNILAPGTYASFQINFRGPCASRSLKLKTKCGKSVEVEIPRTTHHTTYVTYASFPIDGKSMNLRLHGHDLPSVVRVNGRTCKIKVLRDFDQEAIRIVKVELGTPLSSGDVVFSEIMFEAGGVDMFLIRAMLGVSVEAPYGDGDNIPLSKKDCLKYGFDNGIVAYRLPHDVVCNDVRMNEKGYSAVQCLGSRVRYHRNNPKGLCGVDFCTALYPQAWSIYAPMGDVVYSKPYRLHWGANPAVFMEEEELAVVQAVQNAAPRPVIWVPERFRAKRELTGPEYEQLAWSSFMVGARTLRCHHWKNDIQRPFDKNPSLERSVIKFNRDFNKIRGLLGSFVPFGVRTDRDERIKIFEGWCADEGVLLLLRDLSYGKNPLTFEKKDSPSIPSEKIRKISLDYKIPEWMCDATAYDALTGCVLDSKVAGRRLTVSLADFETYKLVFIANKNKMRKD